MAEEPADGLAAAAIERTLTVFERLRAREQAELVQARKAVTQHIYGMITAGEYDENRLVVGGLTELKRREREL
jgi:hypothetical protein